MKRHWCRDWIRARLPVLPSTYSSKSLAPIARCLASRASSARLTSVPAPRRRKPRLQSKQWGCLTDYLTNGTIRHAVNVAPLDCQNSGIARGYVDVAYRLGMLLAGLQDGNARECRLNYRGEIADRDTKVLTAVFAAGLLKHALDEEVNLVNAEYMLRDRGHRTDRRIS